ncbi:MAG: hypothetical protein R2807_10700 [Chitinophagales bacterium]
MSKKLLLKYDHSRINTIEVYRPIFEGYQALEKALKTMQPGRRFWKK